LTKPLVPEKIKSMLNKYLIKEAHSNEATDNDDAEIESHIGFDELVNLFNNKAIIKEVIVIALKSFPDQILELEEACNEKHLGKVFAAAHRIKGSSSSMRLRIMAKIAEKIETESNANWNDNLELQLAELKAEWEIVKKFIQQKIN
jgi:HPt (histidine-containing phosphotransfer) domain-containing protein